MQPQPPHQPQHTQNQLPQLAQLPPHHSNPPANPHGAPQQRTGLPDLLHNSANIISAPSQVPQPQQQYQQPHIAPVRQEQVNHVPSIYLAPRPTETTLPQINNPNESTTTQVPQLKRRNLNQRLLFLLQFLRLLKFKIK